MNPTLIIVPTYNERENLPRMARTPFVAAGRRWTCWWWTTIRRTARAKSPMNWRRNTRKFTSCTGAEKNGLGRAYIAGFKWALERNYEFIFEMDGDFSHNPDDVPDVSRSRQECRPGARLALRRRHPRHQLAAETADVEPLRGQLRQARHRHAVHRPDRRLQMFPPPRAAGHQPRRRPVQRLQLSD